jgi:hypothetical protein
MRAALIAGTLAVLYLLIDPPSADLAAQVYRTGLFEREGFTLWNGGWYGGHFTPGYSVLFPPLAALLGPRVVGALSAVVAAWLFDRIATAHVGSRRARVGSSWFAVAVAINLMTGRLTFALGVALGLAAVVAAQRERIGLACAAAALTTLASPVAGAFLCIGAAAWVLAKRRPAAVALGAAAALPGLALALTFPEGGTEPFVASAFWPALAAQLAALALLPREERTLRWTVALTALLCTAAYVLSTPVGGNATRLAALMLGPALACMLWRRRPVALALIAVPLVYWQWYPPVRDAVRANDDPSIRATYYAPLLTFLGRQGAAGPYRVEVPFTANHWEAAWLAPHVPIARGWERQLDVANNSLFYEGGLTPERYRRWLAATAVRYVAVPDARLDDSARAEVALVTAGQPWLRPVWRDDHWRVYAVTPATPLATGAARAVSLGDDTVSLRARRAGSALVRVRFNPYWAVTRGDACVRRAAGGWTGLEVRRPGALTLSTRFAVGRIRAGGDRCPH